MISFPPHRYSPSIESFQFKKHHDTIDYFITQDCIYLEEKRVWCPTCNEGFLEKSAKKLAEETSLDETHRTITEVWTCSKCGKELTHFNVSSIEKIRFHD
jgi:uncharacterized protein with PIN domain